MRRLLIPRSRGGFFRWARTCNVQRWIIFLNFLNSYCSGFDVLERSFRLRFSRSMPGWQLLCKTATQTQPQRGRNHLPPLFAKQLNDWWSPEISDAENGITAFENMAPIFPLCKLMKPLGTL
jgi:hypothetical protein